jgi:hypothetical protein
MTVQNPINLQLKSMTVKSSHRPVLVRAGYDKLDRKDQSNNLISITFCQQVSHRLHRRVGRWGSTKLNNKGVTRPILGCTTQAGTFGTIGSNYWYTRDTKISNQREERLNSLNWVPYVQFGVWLAAPLAMVLIAMPVTTKYGHSHIDLWFYRYAVPDICE